MRYSDWNGCMTKQILYKTTVMKVIIVDDEQASRAIIKQLCETTKSIDVVAEFENALEAIKFLNKKT